MKERVRVATWNLWWRLGPWEARRPAIEAALAELQADVVALQEVWSTPVERQLDRLAVAAGLKHIEWAEFTDSARWQRRVAGTDATVGVGLLSRWPIVHREVRRLTLANAPDEGRVALGVVVDHPQGRLPVVVAHLHSHPARSSTRVAQVRMLARFVAELDDAAHRLGDRRVLPAVLAGDFNAEPLSDEMRLLSGVLTDPVVELRSMMDAWRLAPDGDPGWTWRRENPYLTVGNPDARVDHIYFSLDDSGALARITEVGLFGLGPGPTGVWPSDHAGVWADVDPS